MKVCDVCKEECREFKEVQRKYLDDDIKDICKDCYKDIVKKIKEEARIFSESTKSEIRKLVK